MRSVGLDPVEVRAKTGEPTLALRAAEKCGAVGVLALRARGSIEVTVMSPDTGEVVYRSTITAKGTTPASVRAVEELHGRLVAFEVEATDTASIPGAEADEAPRYDASSPAAEAAPSGVGPDSPPQHDARQEHRRDDEPHDAHARTSLWLGAQGGPTATPSWDRVAEMKLEARIAPWSHFAVSAMALLHASCSAGRRPRPGRRRRRSTPASSGGSCTSSRVELRFAFSSI